MKTAGIIIAVVYAIVHVVSMILQQQEKQRRAKASRDAAARPGRPGGLAGSAGQAGPAGDGDFRPAPPTAGAGRRADDLAARRRAQIEQLRQRREDRRQGTPIQPVPVVRGEVQPYGSRRPTEAPVAGRAPGPIGLERQRIAQQQQQQQQRRDAEQRARQAEQARRERQEHLARQRKAEAELERERAAADLTQRTDEPPQPADAAQPQFAPTEPTAPGAHARERMRFRQSIRAQLKDPAKLRRLLVLKEVLEPPLALRPG